MGDASASRSRANRFRIFVAVGATAVLAGGAAIGASAADASPTLASQLAARFPGYHIPATVSKTPMKNGGALAALSFSLPYCSRK